ncbi:hypothetical protein LCGC14_0750700 [marine sediment metagenome]|uniref:Restriction endonuclease type IV Mrr domain-containing protein n=1 Tax=marine sediment metagenome TaxID=412755 RepID=A0A0F9TB08_9ZZZZ
MSNPYKVLKEWYEKLQKVPKNVDKKWFQNRGREFEKLLSKLFKLESLEPRTSYRPKGEEIDGSFYFDGKFFLLEAKWRAKPTPSSQIFAFKGKVNGKLIGTLGVFVSIAGYSKDAANAVVLGQDINIILFDQEDFEWCLNSEKGFRNILKFKLRAAAEHGSIYTPYSSEIIEYSAKIEEKPSVMEKIPINIEVKEDKESILIFCEGQTDELIILTILNRLHFRNKSIRIMKMYGYRNIKQVISHVGENSSLPPLFRGYNKIIIIIDGDSKKVSKYEFFNQSLKKMRVPYEIIIPEPSIEIWLKPNSKDAGKEIILESQIRNISRFQCILFLAQNTDLDDLYISEDGSFKLFKDFIESSIII